MPNIDADPRNADWLRVLERAREFGEWTHEQIAAECEPAYEAYAETLRDRHRRGPNSPQSARGEVFLEHLSWVSTLLPPELWHHSWWAAKSSQTLALTLLAASCRLQATVSWLPFADQLGPQRLGLFEVELAADVLNEQPYQTQIDFLATGSPNRPRSTPEKRHRSSISHTRSCCTNPRNESRHKRRRQPMRSPRRQPNPEKTTGRIARALLTPRTPYECFAKTP